MLICSNAVLEMNQTHALSFCALGSTKQQARKFDHVCSLKPKQFRGKWSSIRSRNPANLTLQKPVKTLVADLLSPPPHCLLLQTPMFLN